MVTAPPLSVSLVTSHFGAFKNLAFPWVFDVLPPSLPPFRPPFTPKRSRCPAVCSSKAMFPFSFHHGAPGVLLQAWLMFPHAACSQLQKVHTWAGLRFMSLQGDAFTRVITVFGFDVTGCSTAFGPRNTEASILVYREGHSPLQIRGVFKIYVEPEPPVANEGPCFMC